MEAVDLWIWPFELAPLHPTSISLEMLFLGALGIHSDSW